MVSKVYPVYYSCFSIQKWQSVRLFASICGTYDEAGYFHVNRFYLYGIVLCCFYVASLSGQYVFHLLVFYSLYRLELNFNVDTRCLSEFWFYFWIFCFKITWVFFCIGHLFVVSFPSLYDLVLFCIVFRWISLALIQFPNYFITFRLIISYDLV